ncbi:MAG: hypothetical protein WBE18_07000 [Gammaproteobacteria bacterium]
MQLPQEVTKEVIVFQKTRKKPKKTSRNSPPSPTHQSAQSATHTPSDAQLQIDSILILEGAEFSLDKDKPIPVSHMQRLLRGFFVTSVGVDILYSVFLRKILREAIEEAFKTFGKEISPDIQKYINFILIPIVLVSVIYDMSPVDPVRAADDIYRNNFRKKKNQEIAKKLIFNFIFNLTLQLISILTSSPAGAASDAIPVIDFANQNIDNKILLNAVRYGSLGILVTATTLYYYILTNDQIKKHADAFVEIMKDLSGFGRNLYKHPSAHLEILFQTITNACYRGLSYSFYVQDIADEIFPYLSPKVVSKASLVTAINTAIITLFTRTLRTHKQFLNPEFELLTKEEKTRATAWCKKFVLDIFLSIISAGAAGVLFKELLSPRLHFPLNYIVPLAGTALTLVHSLATRYTARRNQNALEAKSQNNQSNLQKNLEQSGEDKSVSTEIAPLLPKTEPPDQIERMLNHYNQIYARQKSATKNNISGMVVFITQLARFVSFYLFTNSINTIFGLQLSLIVIMAIAVLFGTRVALNNSAFMQVPIIETWEHYGARYELLEDRRKMSLSSFEGRFFGSFKNLVLAPLTGPTDFSENELEACAKKGTATIPKPEAEDSSVTRSSSLV